MNTLSRTQRGLTLIETLVSLTISGLLSAQAIPSLREFQQRQRLESVTQSFVTDLQQARSLAVSQGESIQLHFSPQAGGSCYVLHTGKKGDCECDAAGHPVCIDPAQMIKASWL
ncbi:MAG TPA: GspH/FimT family pseudopilin, partial [Burkholderiaceae bacterium]